MRILALPLAALLGLALPVQAQEETDVPSPNQIVDEAPREEWVTIPPENLLVMTLAPATDGAERRVVIQLMPEPFLQGWVANIRTLARAEWYDGITVNRVQDNYVVQWGDPNYDNPGGWCGKTLPEDWEREAESESHYAMQLKAAAASSRCGQTRKTGDSLVWRPVAGTAHAFREGRIDA